MQPLEFFEPNPNRSQSKPSLFSTHLKARLTGNRLEVSARDNEGVKAAYQADKVVGIAGRALRLFPIAAAALTGAAIYLQTALPSSSITPPPLKSEARTETDSCDRMMSPDVLTIARRDYTRLRKQTWKFASAEDLKGCPRDMIREARMMRGPKLTPAP